MKAKSTILKVLGKNHPARRAADRRLADEQERKANGQSGSGSGGSGNGSNEASAKKHDEKKYYDFSAKLEKEHPDAKRIHLNNGMTQYVVGPRDTVVGYYDHETGEGKITKRGLS